MQIHCFEKFVILLLLAIAIALLVYKTRTSGSRNDKSVWIAGAVVLLIVWISFFVVAKCCDVQCDHENLKCKSLIGGKCDSVGSGQRDMYQTQAGEKEVQTLESQKLHSRRNLPEIVLTRNQDLVSNALFVLQKDGSVEVQGTNNHGQLGLVDVAMRSLHRVDWNKNNIQVVAGQNFTLVLKDDGKIWGAGQNGPLEQELNYDHSQSDPERTEFAGRPLGSSFVASGNPLDCTGHLSRLATDSIYSICRAEGQDSDYQGFTNPGLHFIDRQPNLQDLRLKEDATFEHIAAGGQYFMANFLQKPYLRFSSDNVIAAQQVFVDFVELWDYVARTDEDSPYSYNDVTTTSDQYVRSYLQYVLAVSEGKVYGWGSNVGHHLIRNTDYNETFYQDFSDSFWNAVSDDGVNINQKNIPTSPSAVQIHADAFPLNSMTKVYASDFCVSAALTTDGKVYMWAPYLSAWSSQDNGYKIYKEIMGDPTRPIQENEFNKPRMVVEDSGIDLKGIVDLSIGYVHCLACDSDGNLYGWGSNAFEGLYGLRCQNHLDYGFDSSDIPTTAPEATVLTKAKKLNWVHEFVESRYTYGADDPANSFPNGSQKPKVIQVQVAKFRSYVLFDEGSLVSFGQNVRPDRLGDRWAVIDQNLDMQARNYVTNNADGTCKQDGPSIPPATYLPTLAGFLDEMRTGKIDHYGVAVGSEIKSFQANDSQITVVTSDGNIYSSSIDTTSVQFQKFQLQRTALDMKFQDDEDETEFDKTFQDGQCPFSGIREVSGNDFETESDCMAAIRLFLSNAIPIDSTPSCLLFEGDKSLPLRLNFSVNFLEKKLLYIYNQVARPLDTNVMLNPLTPLPAQYNGRQFVPDSVTPSVLLNTQWDSAFRGMRGQYEPMFELRDALRQMYHHKDSLLKELFDPYVDFMRGRNDVAKISMASLVPKGLTWFQKRCPFYDVQECSIKSTVQQPWGVEELVTIDYISFDLMYSLDPMGTNYYDFDMFVASGATTNTKRPVISYLKRTNNSVSLQNLDCFVSSTIE